MQDALIDAEITTLQFGDGASAGLAATSGPKVPTNAKGSTSGDATITVAPDGTITVVFKPTTTFDVVQANVFTLLTALSAGGGLLGRSASEVRAAIDAAQAVVVTPVTVALAKLTGGGANGSIQFDASGRYVNGSYTAPT